MQVVTSLLESCGGALAVQESPQGGTTVLVALPGELPSPAAQAQAGPR
jgi:hypothetical protein